MPDYKIPKSIAVYMARLPAIQDQGYAWQVVTFWTYLEYLITREYEVRIDWYKKESWPSGGR